MSYLGGKGASGVYQAIVALLPPHDTYVEPFAGSGQVLRRKAPCFQSIALDLDPACVFELAQLPRVEAHCGCGLAYLETLDVAAAGRVVIYADPPYPLETRTSAKRYAHEFTEADHRRLFRALQRAHELGAAVICSTYPNPLYGRFFGPPDWFSRDLQAMTRGGVRTERLYFNFPPGGPAHWPTFAGLTFTERQRIKRKAARWARMYEDCPPAERQAILAALLAVGDRS